jgi:hypothetical protein
MGVLLNANKIKDKLEVKAPNAQLKRIIDSSWQLDLPYSFLCNKNAKINDKYQEINENDNCIIHKMLKSSIEYEIAFFILVLKIKIIYFLDIGKQIYQTNVKIS